MLTQLEKDALVQRVRQQFTTDFPHVKEEVACLYLSILVCLELMRLNQRPVFQCGSIQWRAVSEAADDGRSATHYSMIWSPHEFKSIQSMLNGGLPELHCWVGLVDSQEVIDLTVKFFPMAWKKAVGYDWSAKVPPDYVWQNIVSCQEEYDARYEPLEAATKYAMQHVNTVIRQRNAK